jgi:hypothetical protein
MDVDIFEEKNLKVKAESGDPFAQYMYGFTADSKGDHNEAIYWYEKAALNEKKRHTGVYEAEKRLGTMYFKGEGVRRDLDKAYDWYGKAFGKINEGYIFPLILTVRDYQIPLVPGEKIYSGHIEKDSSNFTKVCGMVRLNHGGGQKDIPRLFTLDNDCGSDWRVTYKSGYKYKIAAGKGFVMIRAKSIDFGGCVGVISEYGKDD